MLAHRSQRPLQPYVLRYRAGWKRRGGSARLGCDSNQAGSSSQWHWGGRGRRVPPVSACTTSPQPESRHKVKPMDPPGVGRDDLRGPRAVEGPITGGYVNLMPVGMAVGGGRVHRCPGPRRAPARAAARWDELPTSWRPSSWGPSSSVRPSRRSCAPIPPSSPRPSSPGASSAA